MRLDDRLARQAGDLVERLLHRDAVDDVAVLHVAGDLGDDRHRERIPLGQQLAALDARAVLDHQARAVLQAVALALATDLVDERPSRPGGSSPPSGPCFLTSWTLLSRTVPSLRASSERLLGTNLTDATDVERTHRQLRTGLTDRLRRDDADRLADVDHVPRARSRP